MQIKMVRLAGSLLFCAASMAQTASFDCEKAGRPIEKMICSDAALSRLDEDLAIAYKSALASAPDEKFMKNWQRNWLKSVARCKTVACLQEEYGTRVDLLKRVAPRGSPMASWSAFYKRIKYPGGDRDDGTSSITLVGLSDGGVYADGHAYWIGDRLGEVNMGRLVGIAKSNNKRAALAGDCSAEFELRDDALFIDNEDGCSGWNVTFDGEYRKTELNPHR